MNKPTNGMTKSPMMAEPVAIRTGVLGIRSRRIVLPVSTNEALMPTSARAAATMPVDQDADEPIIQAQAIMVRIATGEPGTMGKMVPKMATNISKAAMRVTMTSTVAVYSCCTAVVQDLVFNGCVSPHEVVGTVIGVHTEEAAVIVSAFGVSF